MVLSHYGVLISLLCICIIIFLCDTKDPFNNDRILSDILLPLFTLFYNDKLPQNIAVIIQDLLAGRFRA